MVVEIDEPHIAIWKEQWNSSKVRTPSYVDCVSAAQTFPALAYTFAVLHHESLSHVPQAAKLQFRTRWTI